MTPPDVRVPPIPSGTRRAHRDGALVMDRLGDLQLLFPAIRAKGNGFAMGEVTGPGVVRWHTFLRVRLEGGL